jgi:hypothetical protein
MLLIQLSISMRTRNIPTWLIMVMVTTAAFSAPGKLRAQTAGIPVNSTVSSFKIFFLVREGETGFNFGAGPIKDEVYSVPHTTDSLRLDGVLNESFWDQALVVDLPFEIDPGENIPAKVKTECLLITAPKHLYAAFRAHDPDPSAIRAHYMDRDAAWDDDWVLLEVDPFFDRRRGFQFLVNPLGVQMDSLINEVGSSENQVDITWDAIWDSAGRITAQGYVVELAIPFTTLRFPGGQEAQKWGFQVVRHFPRDFSYFFKITPWNRNLNCTLCENSTLVGFERASPGKNIEINPALVIHRTDQRKDFPQGRLEEGKAGSDFGLSARWGITPNVMANAAVNPDFSQVEADVAQLEINTRFALFYPEKRPFFLEGADLFLTPLAAVYTRTLADPAWGLKLTGKEKGNAFGILVSRDETTNLLLPANQGSRLELLEQGAISSVLRYRRDVGRQSTVGILLSDRRGKDYSNSIVGADAHIQLGSVDKIKLQFLYSRTSYPTALAAEQNQPTGMFSDSALSLAYLHEARDWNWWAKYEDLGRNFRADVGFIPRVDLRMKEAGARRILWGDSSRWFRKWIFTLKGSLSHDRAGILTDRMLEASGEYYGPLQSTFCFGLVSAREVWREVPFDQEYLRIESSIRPSGSLLLTLAGKFGGAVDYAGSRPAEIVQVKPGFSWFLGRHLQIGFDHSREHLRVAGGCLYRAGLSQARIVYQFSLRTFFRAIFQYLDLERNLALYVEEPDPLDKHLFIQFLFAYKVNPQTLLFLGYSDNHFDRPGIDLTRKDRTFFLKISYAWLF